MFVAAVPFAAALIAAAPARADLKLCSRMSYVVEGAIGIEQGKAVATRGWFRVDPGQCRDVAQGELQFDPLYVHARALPVYGASPLPESGNADLCVAAGTVDEMKRDRVLGKMSAQEAFRRHLEQV